MKEAIQKAIEGGWKWHEQKTKLIQRGDELRFQMDGYTERVDESVVREDRFFWQALGITEGWSETETAFIGTYRGKPQYDHLYWKHVWHRFIDHLAKGKDAESFFNDLFIK